jgi:hypothetical protein
MKATNNDICKPLTTTKGPYSNHDAIIELNAPVPENNAEYINNKHNGMSASQPTSHHSYTFILCSLYFLRSFFTLTFEARGIL